MGATLAAPLCLMLLFLRHVFGGKGGALAEEELLQLFDQEFLVLRVGRVQTVFVQQDLAVIHPHGPSVPGNVLIDALAEIVIEGRLVETRQLALELDTRDGAANRQGRGGAHG